MKTEANAIAAQNVTAAAVTTQARRAGWFEKQSGQFERSRFGAMTILLTLQSCIGSIAAMTSLQTDSYNLLMVVASVTMASNSAFIAQSPAKWCLGIFYGSVLINLVVILLNLFS